MVANQERYAAGAMIRAIAVVLDPPAKLGEHEDQHIVASIVSFEIRIQVVDAASHIRPQLALQCQFVGVRVKAAILGVANTRANVRLQHLGCSLSDRDLL